MPWIYQTVFLGHDLALVLPDPDWKQQLIEITPRLTVQVDAGQTGREDRTPRHLVLRHDLTAAWTLSKANTAALETVLSQLGASYIGLPMPVDQLTPARWADRIFDAQWVVEYDETGYQIHAADALPPSPAKRWLAPLYVGRRKELPKLTALDDGRGRFKLTLLERSPWDFRIAPAPQALAGVDWPASIEANWKELPESGTEDIIVYEDMGDGRVEGVQGIEGVTRRTQSMLVTCQSRAQIRALLNFFFARKGRTQSFSAPWCLRPGADTPETPHTTKARFSEDAFTLRFSTDLCASAKIGFTQVPWEVDGVAGETPERAPEAYYYRFAMDVPGGPLVWRFTSWEHDLQRVEGGVPVVYLGDVSGLFQHDQITQTIDLSDEPTTIGSWLFVANPLVRVLQRTLDVPLTIEIFKGNPATPATIEQVYQGDVADVEIEDRKLSATTIILGGQLDGKVPNLFFGPVCNHEFCGPGCNEEGAMPEAHWTFAGTVVSWSGNEVVLDITSNPPGAALVNDYFAKAWIQKGAGESYELRHIVRSVLVAGVRQRFTLKKPFRAIAAGDVLGFRAYCSGTWGECMTKFSNDINFGAHPHIGNENLSFPQRETESTGAKK